MTDMTDIADIIAGELKVSRGTAYDMMRAALPADAPTKKDEEIAALHLEIDALHKRLKECTVSGEMDKAWVKQALHLALDFRDAEPGIEVRDAMRALKAHFEGRPASMPMQDARIIELEKQLSETRKHLDAALHELAYGTHTMAQQFNRETP